MERLTERAEIDKCPGIWVKEGFANEGNKTWFNGYDEGYSAINKCTDYEDLEEQGKLLKLPCAVGDTVYEVQDLRKRIQPYTVVAVHISNCGNLYGWELKDGKGVYSNVNGFSEYAIGKQVFLTREEAEAALKELERGKHERAGKDLDSG